MGTTTPTRDSTMFGKQTTHIFNSASADLLTSFLPPLPPLPNLRIILYTFMIFQYRAVQLGLDYFDSVPCYRRSD